MEYYELLTCATLVIGTLAAALWMRTRNISIILGIALWYYWSLYGAWSLITDKLGGSSGRQYGYLEAKMFAVTLDDNYFQALVYYSFFIIIVEITLLFLVRVGSPHQVTGSPLHISHTYILLFVVAGGTISWLIESPYLGRALELGISGYHATRDPSPYFTIHELLNRAALVTLAIGFATLCSGRAPRLISGERRAWTGTAYLTVIAAMYVYNLALGNKNEPLNAGLLGLLVYLHNCRRRPVVAVAAVVTLGMCGLWLIDRFRAYPLSQLEYQFANLDFSSLLGNSYGLVNSSEEAFAAHFSMYGALAYRIAPVLGQSFISLAASMVPRLMWKSRPADIYAYYAANVGAVSGQGYTIHHATGWYLNFGGLGVPLGAVVLGCVWSGCLNAYALRSRASSRWGLAFRTLAPWLFVAFLPNLIRAGIEAYKALLFEGLLIPTTLVALTGARLGGSRAVSRLRTRREPMPLPERTKSASAAASHNGDSREVQRSRNGSSQFVPGV